MSQSWLEWVHTQKGKCILYPVNHHTHTHTPTCTYTHTHTHTHTHPHVLTHTHMYLHTHTHAHTHTHKTTTTTTTNRKKKKNSLKTNNKTVCTHSHCLPEKNVHRTKRPTPAHTGNTGVQKQTQEDRRGALPWSSSVGLRHQLAPVQCSAHCSLWRTPSTWSRWDGSVAATDNTDSLWARQTNTDPRNTLQKRAEISLRQTIRSL